MAFRPAETRDDDRRELALEAGECAICAHLLVLRSRRSRFVRCGRAGDDPRFPRYPPLPRRGCPGFEPFTARPDHTRSQDG